MSPKLLKKLPLSIRQSRDPQSGDCEFTIKMSWELAEQFKLVAAPFLRELNIAVSERQAKEAENAVRLASLGEAAKRVRYYALHVIKLERMERAELLDVCEEIGLLNDIDPRQLFNAAQMLMLPLLALAGTAFLVLRNTDTLFDDIMEETPPNTVHKQFVAPPKQNQATDIASLKTESIQYMNNDFEEPHSVIESNIKNAETQIFAPQNTFEETRKAPESQNSQSSDIPPITPNTPQLRRGDRFTCPDTRMKLQVRAVGGRPKKDKSLIK